MQFHHIHTLFTDIREERDTDIMQKVLAIQNTGMCARHLHTPMDANMPAKRDNTWFLYILDDIAKTGTPMDANMYHQSMHSGFFCESKRHYVYLHFWI